MLFSWIRARRKTKTRKLRHAESNLIVWVWPLCSAIKSYSLKVLQKWQKQPRFRRTVIPEVKGEIGCPFNSSPGKICTSCSNPRQRAYAPSIRPLAKWVHVISQPNAESVCAFSQSPIKIGTRYITTLQASAFLLAIITNRTTT